jgi:membrane protease YdiL (CAAX protease family)
MMPFMLGQAEFSDPPWLTQPMLEWALDGVGGLTCLAVLIHWRRRRRDPLRGAPLRPNRLEPLSVVALVGFYFFVVGLMSMVAHTGSSATDEPSPEDKLRLAMMQPVVALMSGVACLVLGRWSFRAGLRGMGFGRRAVWRDLGFALFAYIAAAPLLRGLYYVSVLVIEAARPEFTPPDHQTLDLLRQPETTVAIKAWLIVGAAVIAPFSEEVFFRGILQTVIRGILGSRWAAIGCTGLIFGLIHMSQPQAVLPLAMFGCVLGYAYERTGSLLCPILLHALFNTVSLAVSLFLDPIS